MISREQCRAARGLLGWTQQDLADAAGMSKTGINNFERGTSDIRAESLEAIRGAFEKAEIEFVGDYGVQQRRETVRILKGRDAVIRLWDDIFETLKNGGGEVLISNADERRASEAAPEILAAHLERLKAYGIAERLLVCEGDTFFLQPAACYRWLPRAVFQAGMTSFVYGGKVAIRLWGEAMTIVITAPAAYEAERQRFEYLWQNALIPAHDGPGKNKSH